MQRMLKRTEKGYDLPFRPHSITYGPPSIYPWGPIEFTYGDQFSFTYGHPFNLPMGLFLNLPMGFIQLTHGDPFEWAFQFTHGTFSQFTHGSHSI